MENDNYRLAILFTCFNRKDQTIRCVKSLLAQDKMPQFDLYVCDDASTDGTVEALKELLPNVFIIEGNGSLFWSRGMNKAMSAAVKQEYQYYLMINDDVEFMPDMWIKMMSAYEKNYPCGVVGCMLSKKTKMQSYGGSLFISDKKGDYVGPMLAPKSDEYVKCDLANWNCFLINNEIVMKVGLIDSRYEHAMGDFDYSFRMRRSGYTIILAKEYVGYCENNGIHNTYKDKQLGRKKRLKKLFSANGLPVKSWYYFTKTYYEHGHIRNFLVPYIKYLSCIILGRDCD